MKSKLKFLLVADNAIVDEKTQKLSVIGLFSSIVMTEEKIALSFVVAGQLNAENAETGDRGEVKVSIISPNGEVHKENSVSGVFEKGKEISFIVYFSVVEFMVAGEYKVEVTLNGEKSVKDDRHCYFNVKKNG